MIINITQHCTLRCPHCMQNAGTERTEFIDTDTFNKALDFAKLIGSHTVLISGGEPTSHPDIIKFTELALQHEHNFIVSILSNGTFTRDRKLSEQIADLTKKYKHRLTLQITSVKSLYTNYDEIHKPGLRAIRTLGDACTICDNENDIRMQPLGRAASGEYYMIAEQTNAFPSCTNTALAIAQIPEMSILPGAILERLGRFCSPMVTYDGAIRLGESIQCKTVANINQPLETILTSIKNFKPCGGCTAFKWHLSDPQTEKEKNVHKILFPDPQQED